MIPKNRTEGRYKGFDPRTLPTDSYERIYQSHDPKIDSLEHTTFDLRAPHNSHMSTVAYLERTFDFVLEQTTNAGHLVPAELDADHVDYIEVGSPGFALQNNIKNMTMDFGYTTVVEHPHEWVPFYTHLYPDSPSTAGAAFTRSARTPSPMKKKGRSSTKKSCAASTPLNSRA